MNKNIILIMIAALLMSGCIDKTVKTGDNISVDYTGSFLNGKVFDTTIEKVALENNLPPRGGPYQPRNFTVGKGQMIKGFDVGVIGMRVGETRKLTIPPEQAYGSNNPGLIRVIPNVLVLPATSEIPKVIKIPVSAFEQVLGSGHKVGDIVKMPETNINATIQNISSTVSLIYDLKVGDEVWSQNAPWNQTVVKIENNNITLMKNVSKNDIVRLPNTPWNSTVVGLDNINITLRHNPIPETVIPSMNGQTKVSFNETSIIMDKNPEVVGKTLIFNVTLVSIK